MPGSFHLIGLISDTHGLMRPQALNALKDSELVIHCGDIGDPAVMEALQKIAPVRAVRGNNDKGAWAVSFPDTDVVEVGGYAIYVLHNLRSSPSIQLLVISQLLSLGIRTNPRLNSGARFYSSTRAALVHAVSLCQLQLPRSPCGQIVVKPR